ncbi:MAG: flagellar export protein FliJ [Phycisphaerales bacterium]|nr:MAG: flagellar export protein FliJ [Phycisphaerales bacterium]
MPRPFKFRLETVLKLRKQNEDKHKRIVAGRIRQLNAVRQRMAAQERQIAAETEAVRSSRARGAISIEALARGRHWLTHLQRGLLETQGHARVIKAHLAQERSDLARAAKEAKALEKLKERQRLRHDQEERRAETRELDEMSILRFRPPQPIVTRSASRTETNVAGVSDKQPSRSDRPW